VRTIPAPANDGIEDEPERRWWGFVAENDTIPHHLGRFDPRAVTLGAAVAG
jgi:hypothetical protein